MRLATSFANANAGTAINTTGSQSGVHTLRLCPYGLGDGSTTFNVPNWEGKVPVGFDVNQAEFDSPGITSGSKTQTLSEANLPSVTVVQNAHAGHTFVQPEPNVSNNAASGSNIKGFANPATTTQNVGSTTATNQAFGSGTAHNNLQPGIVCFWFIHI